MTQWSRVQAPVAALSSNNLEQVVHAHVPRSSSECSLAGKVTAGLAENNSSLLLSGWLKATRGMTACTPDQLWACVYFVLLFFLLYICCVIVSTVGWI